jgi:Spy/CpxP family protein refolding chaperone
VKKLIALVAACLLATVVHAAEPAPPDSARMEKDLQRLPWEQFKAVISAVPKLKADVEAYGPMGWNFVKTRYRTHGWKKNIDKLDATQKQQLQKLIEKSRRAPD